MRGRIRPVLDLVLEELGIERALAVGAHPDDAEFFAGGTLARLVDLGTEVSLLVCTDGGRGGRGVAEVARVRRKEQEAAARTLGIARVERLDRPDGELVHDRDLCAALVYAIRRLRPDLLLTHDPETLFRVHGGRASLGHSDHRTAGLAVLDAVYPRAGSPNFFPEQLAEPGVETHGPAHLWLFDSARPDARVEIGTTLERKLAALRCHESQAGSGGGMIEAARRLALDAGAPSGAAESFLALRLRRPAADPAGTNSARARVASGGLGEAGRT
jgi:LmbE family N-acetylglucosaminyl deacetylase